MNKNKILVSLWIIIISLISFNITDAYEPWYEKELENRVNNIIEKYEKIQNTQRTSEKIDYREIPSLDNIEKKLNEMWLQWEDRDLIEQYFIIKTTKPDKNIKQYNIKDSLKPNYFNI